MTTYLTPDGEIVGHEVQASFGDVLRRDGVAQKVDVRCSYDATTADGAGYLARAMAAQEKQDSRLPYYGKSFMMAAYTSRVVVTKRDGTGKPLPSPKPLIRSVIECVDGTIITSSSSYVYEGLEAIRMAHPDMSAERPVECIFYKGGQSDKIRDVVACAPRTVTSAPATVAGKKGGK